jgi:hypothetical protein
MRFTTPEVDEETDSALGAGSQISGVVKLPFLGEGYKLFLSSYFGKGMGGLSNDGVADAEWDAAKGELKALDIFGLMTAYQHYWHPNWSTTITYGNLEIDNQEFQHDQAYDHTNYGEINLVWMPDQNWYVGAGVVAGDKTIKNGNEVSNYRTQFSTRYLL